jgi:glycosyltransferase involved in cell wall biosynthesis
MRILLLSRYDRLGASSRIRSYQYVPALKARGIEVEGAPLLTNDYLMRFYKGKSRDWISVLNSYLRRILTLLRARQYDLLWIEKELFPGTPAWFEQVLASVGVPYIVDYDDAIFHRYELSPSLFGRMLVKKIDTVMRNAIMVICGNSYLAKRARLAKARRIEILPSVVDLERYQISKRSRKESIVIGWIGSPSTAPYLEMLIPSLRELSKERAVEMRVIGAVFRAPRLDIDCRPWSEETEVREIQDIDIGVMPLLDSPWERGKCGYKLLQYMACGLPVVASAVGVNQEIVLEGGSGFLATDQDSWSSALRRLCADSELRSRMGMEGRSIVEKSYSLQAAIPRLTSLLENAARPQ